MRPAGLWPDHRRGSEGVSMEPGCGHVWACLVPVGWLTLLTASEATVFPTGAKEPAVKEQVGLREK